MRPTIKILNEKYELYAVPTMRDEIAVQNEMVNLLSINGRNGYEQLAMLDQTIMENRERHRNALIERYGQEGFDNNVAKFRTWMKKKRLNCLKN
jgi:predicted RNA-binding protein with RPS1 domain